MGGGTDEQRTRLLQQLRRGPTPPGSREKGIRDTRHIAAVDPERGLILTFARNIRASYHYGGLGEIGGGPYLRTFEPRQSSATRLIRISQLSEIGLQAEILAAMNSEFPETIIEITDDQEYKIDQELNLTANKTLQIRAANGRRPVIRLNRDRCSGGLKITLAEGSCLTLDGLLIAENGLEVHGDNANGKRRLEIRHCTLVPGCSVDTCRDGYRPSLEIDLAGGVVQIASSIVGRIRRVRRSEDDPTRLRHPTQLAIADSIIDGKSGKSGDSPQAINGRDDFQTHIDRSTLFGEVVVSTLAAQDSLFCDPVHVRIRDTGGLRYCYVPVCPKESTTSARYYCQPDLNRKQQQSIRDCEFRPEPPDSTAKMLEGDDMLTYCRFEVLSFGKADVLPPRITEDITEELYSATTFLSKVNRVSRPIHLSLSTRRSFKANHWSFRLRAAPFDIGAKICSTVLLVSLSRGFTTATLHFELGCIEPAFFAAIDFSGMTGRKRTVARLPQATALRRRRLRDLRSLLAMIRIGVGQSGVRVP